MAERPEPLTPKSRQAPLILIIPENDETATGSWHIRWEAKRGDCRRVELGMWEEPHRNTWVNKLNLEIHRADAPVVIVAHGLGCVTTAWWAEYEQPRYAAPVVGALLVAPPDVERPGRDPRLARFGACPRKPLPFPSFLVASGNDPHCPFDTAVSLARDWGSRFAFAGDVGHLDASSNLGEWPLGERLLNRLIAEMTECPDAKGTLPACASASPMRVGRPVENSTCKGLAEPGQWHTG